VANTLKNKANVAVGMNLTLSTGLLADCLGRVLAWACQLASPHAYKGCGQLTLWQTDFDGNL
jgi:hypothetical protein